MVSPFFHYGNNEVPTLLLKETELELRSPLLIVAFVNEKLLTKSANV